MGTITWHDMGRKDCEDMGKAQANGIKQLGSPSHISHLTALGPYLSMLCLLSMSLDACILRSTRNSAGLR